MSAELKAEVNTWATYEQLKAELPQDLTEAEYEQACRELADELGL